MSFECKRCGYNAKQKTDMKRHLNKKTKCPRNLESYKYNEDELDLLSLFDNKNIENKKNINKKSKIKILFTEDVNENNIVTQNNNINDNNNIMSENNNINNMKNMKNMNEILLYVSKNKIKNCMYCDLEFTRVFDLKRHIQKSCKKVLFQNNNIIQNNNSNNINDIDRNDLNTNDLNTNDLNTNNLKKNIKENNNTIIQNITNQQINNNITINIYNDSNKVATIPFDQKWDVSNFDDNQKLLLLLQDIKFTNTLEKILENEKNQNVIIDKNNNSGLVYKNDIEKFINMKTNDILDKAMYKIYNHLMDFYNEMLEKNYNYSDLQIQRNNIEKKKDDYNKNKNTKENVKNILIQMFDKNKDKVIDRFLELEKYDELSIC